MKERLLWLNVLKLAVDDYRVGWETKEYFRSPDFDEVCLMARVSPVKVRQALSL